MSFDDVARRMQQRHSEGWIPTSDPSTLNAPPVPYTPPTKAPVPYTSPSTDARGQAQVEAQFANASQPIPSAVVVPPGAKSAPTPAAKQPALKPSFHTEDPGDVMMRLAQDEKRRSAKSDMLVGGLMCAVGVIITAVTFSSASDGGGTYVIAWGPAIFGAIRFFRGLSRLA